MSGGHGHGAADGSNKTIALLISVLALFLAFGETMAKSAQTTAISDNVEAANLWAFFQAKTIRMTSVRVATDQTELQRAALPPGTNADAYAARFKDWKETLERWNSEPETGEGRKELAAKAKQAEARRDTALARYHHYEIGSAAFQIGIVMSSAMLITGIGALAWAGAGLGIVGLVMLGIGLVAPHSVHFI